MTLLKTLLLSVPFFVSAALVSVTGTKTTIVVIDGRALLVDVDETGKIVTTYMEVKDYFDSPDTDHLIRVEQAKNEYTSLTLRQMDQIRFIALSDNPTEISDVMVSNISDLSMHYQETYANEIVITAAKNHRTAHLLEANISRIKAMFEQYGVATQDIKVEYKVDMGDEPTRFIKVVSHLRDLPAQ